jgi:hypothetical protein
VGLDEVFTFSDFEIFDAILTRPGSGGLNLVGRVETFPMFPITLGVGDFLEYTPYVAPLRIPNSDRSWTGDLIFRGQYFP